MTDFDAHHPAWFFDGPRRAEAVQALKDYFDPVTGATGAWFERLADREHPNEITAQDLVAVSSLAVEIPARKSIWILGLGAAEVTALLEKFQPRDIALWSDAADLSRESPAWELWKLIQEKANACPPGYSGMGVTKTSKLLAAKRPNLIPIQDSLVNSALFKRHIDNYWEPWQRLHQSNEGTQLRQAAESVRDEAGVGELLGPLRIIDIVIWSWAKAHLHSPRHPLD